MTCRAALAFGCQLLRSSSCADTRAAPRSRARSSTHGGQMTADRTTKILLDIQASVTYRPPSKELSASVSRGEHFVVVYWLVVSHDHTVEKRPLCVSGHPPGMAPGTHKNGITHSSCLDRGSEVSPAGPCRGRCWPWRRTASQRPSQARRPIVRPTPTATAAARRASCWR